MCPFLSKQARVISFAFHGCPEQEEFLACLLPLLDCTEVKAGCLLLKFASGLSSGDMAKIHCPTPHLCVTTGMHASWGRNLQLS